MIVVAYASVSGDAQLGGSAGKEHGGSASVRVAIYERVGKVRGKKTDERILNATTDCVWSNVSSAKNALRSALEKQFPTVTPSGNPAEVVYVSAIEYSVDICD